MSVTLHSFLFPIPTFSKFYESYMCPFGKHLLELSRSFKQSLAN
jgi:hypothetical protein